MAINSISVLGDKDPVRSRCSSKTSNLSSSRLIKINFAGKDSCSSSRALGANNNKDVKSPYFTNDKVQLLSRVTEKKVVNKKPAEFVSSFPLAASVYKANSGEFKLKKRGKHKVKKSVLTLPNEPVPMPMAYTVSDLNDSEYFNATNNNTRINKTKKRRSVKRIKKSHPKDPAMEFCDRDARYCSQLNIDLDCSSSEVVNFTGDGERISKLSYKSNNSVKAGNCPHDVWAVLRNINKFQFRPSPPASQQSVVPLRKRRPINRKSNNSNDTHFIETCRTEEFAYISSFEVDSKTRESCSPSSSFDRITVIDKQSEHDEIVQQFSRDIFGSHVKFGEKIKSNMNNQLRAKNKRRLKTTNKKVSQAKKKPDNYESPENKTYNKILQSEGDMATVEKCNNLHLPELNSKTSSIFKTTENCSDNSSIKENDSVFIDQRNNFEKVLVDDHKRNNTKYCKGIDTKVKRIKTTDDSDKQLKGITKVILNKGKESESPKLLESPRKPRLALTLPNTNTPKLSRLEIKKRLANQKFPIIILGKDQITNQGIYVVNVDPPQFDGLDKHIWPYMLEWSEENHSGNIKDIGKKEITKLRNTKVKNQLKHNEDVTICMNTISNHNIVLNKVECKKKKNTLTNNQVKLATEVPSHVQKPKPLFQLKNKMLHFLHKNPASPKVSEHFWSNEPQVNSSLKDKKVGTIETELNYNLPTNNCSLISVRLKETQDKPTENRIVPKSYSPLRHPWAKGKWASDFIENIIKKIRCGVYYTVDRKENKHKIISSEVCTQTEINTSKNVCCQNGPDFEFASTSALKKDDPLKDIPGFDKTFTTLEIETISTNKIAVKHCVTNVVVHFDIQVLGEASNLTNTKKSMSCIPVLVKDTQEKVFKCNTSITNAILPAELCSIIPTMMRNILDTENKLFLQSTIENVQPQPIPVSEFKGPKSPQLIMNLMLPECKISEDIRPLLNGRFQSSHASYKCIKTNFLRPMEIVGNENTILPRCNAQSLYSYFPRTILFDVSVNTSNRIHENAHQENNGRINYCMALQLYEPNKFSIMPYIRLNITDFINQIVHRFKVHDMNKKLEVTYKDLARKSTNIILTTPILLPESKNQNTICLPLSVNTVGIISLFNAFNKNNSEAIQTSTDKSNINETKGRPPILSDDGKTVLRKKERPIKIVRKKSYVKFYRKCSSMSSISNYKCTPLARVTNLEEFCQVLGSNTFCNVLDGCVEKKILGAVEEMKNWITDISPKQALLVLLLMNKKETPNLMRFRPVLLQGIAVNRITKADELDTEIEVVERENFKLAQYEGISYLPASSKNQDALLEELYWIAKTTASDYQKTFDETSEKLLKSLLEKRKKLNPSYLRVMARYVGLGLLAPTKL